jgi:hypothetical protein
LCKDEALESSGALPTFEPSLSRRTSAADGSSLTRRRSLVQTPGVATRNSPIEGRRRTWNSWRAPPVAPEEEAKWSLSSRGIVPRKHLAVAKAEGGHGIALPRAQTPNEMDYSHIGSLELGTLSIVNGAPSPAASAKVALHRSRFGGDNDYNDYFSPPEVDPSPLMMKTTKQRHFRSKSSAGTTTAPLYDNGTVRPRTRQDDGHKNHNDQNSSPPPMPEPRKTFRITNTDDELHFGDLGAKDYAQDYQSAIPDSPFVTEFHHNEQDEPARNFTGTMADAPNTAIEMSGSVLFSRPPQNALSDKQVAELMSRPAARKADSGYSSGGSLRVGGSQGRCSAGSMNSSRSSKNSVQEGQAISPGLSHESIQPDAPLEVRSAHRKLALLQLPGHLGSPTTSESLLSPMSLTSVGSKSSLDSTSSTNQKRLLKRRQSQPEAPVVQSCQSIPEGDSTIPDIPNNVRIKFTRRLSQAPGTDCLTHTYPSKNHELPAELDASTTSNASEEPVVQLSEIEPAQPPPPPPHERQRSLSLFRRRSAVGEKAADKEGGNASLGVVDLGTIAASLGSSPYDAAMSGAPRKSVTSPTHPHQLGGALPRSKSMVSMDSQAAAEWARMRSKDWALVEAEMPQQQRQQRRKSFHNIKMEAGEASASKRRQKSLHEIPPVPTIDTSKFNGSLPAKSRPESAAEQKTPANSSRARRQTEGTVVPPLVDNFEKQEQQEQSVPTHTLEWDAHAQHWSRRRKSIGEGLRERASFNEASASMITSRNNPMPRVDMAVWGRYSGGLAYNHSGGGDVGGSAGTRSQHSKASSKSLQWRNQYGVDLSDVPIMLQEQRA